MLSIKKLEMLPPLDAERPAVISAEIFTPAAAERRRKQDSSRADVIESSEEF